MRRMKIASIEKPSIQRKLIEVYVVPQRVDHARLPLSVDAQPHSSVSTHL